MGISNSLTTRGYVYGEVVSALQKAVRRGDEELACWWAAELDRSGYSAHLWNRLETILSEDIGPAWPEGPAVIRALRDTWAETAVRRNPNHPERLQVMHAVMLMARAPKNRRVDHAIWACYGTNQAVYEVPDYALDMHTARGRQLGRGVEHFEAEAARLEGEADLGEDPWHEAYLAMFANKEAEAVAEEAYNMQWTPRSRKGPDAPKLF